MSKLALLLLLAGFGPTAFAATRVTVEQVEQLLSASHGLPDAKLTAKISDLELTERASSLRLSRWQNEFPGKRTREALLALADASAFLDLPPAEIPNIEKPDPEARKQIFLRTIGYVQTTLPKLPNFIARRSTTHFDDVTELQRFFIKYTVEQYNAFQDAQPLPSIPPPNGPPPLTLGGRSSIVVRYRDGHEVVDAQAGKENRSGPLGTGLTTSGEFGPILSIVMGDAIHGKVSWGHWEQGAFEPMAVFRYTVPQEISHYTVNGVGDGPQLPAYHGEIAVDPVNGRILRVTLVSELKPPWQDYESSMLVEYGPVTIGSGTYTCPIRGVALFKAPSFTADVNAGGVRVHRRTTFPPQTFVNDVSFTEYHVFHGDVRILP